MGRHVTSADGLCGYAHPTSPSSCRHSCTLRTHCTENAMRNVQGHVHGLVLLDQSRHLCPAHIWTRTAARSISLALCLAIASCNGAKPSIRSRSYQQRLAIPALCDTYHIRGRGMTAACAGLRLMGGRLKGGHGTTAVAAVQQILGVTQFKGNWRAQNQGGGGG